MLVPEVYEEPLPEGAKPTAKKAFRAVSDLPDVLPIRLKTDLTDEEKKVSDDAGQLLPHPDQQPLNFEVSTAEDKQRLLNNFERVEFRKVSYTLPILIIYNPSSGKSVNMIPMIEARLQKENIQFEMMPTQKALDTYQFAKDADLDKYSLVVAAGGDGSYHEVVNGMLARSDKKKLPVALIPNGSGNDTCRSLGFNTLDDALNNIVNAEVVKCDTIRTLLDYATEEEVPKDQESQLNHCRHMVINAGFACPANITREAQKYKRCCGTNCYNVATLQEAILGRMKNFTYECELDGQKREDVASIVFMVANGKYTGGGMMCDPFAVMNDGMFDLMYVSDPKVQSLMGVADILGKAHKKGGIHIYDKTCTFLRAKKIKFTLKGIQGRTPDKEGSLGAQSICIDGELISYNKSITMEIVPNNVEFCIGRQKFDEDYKIFV